MAKSKYKSNGHSKGAKSSGQDAQPLLKRGKTREQIKAQVLTNDPTRDYHSTQFNFYGELFVQQLPQWRLWTGRMMLTSDPVVNFALNVRNAALMPAEIKVTAKNPLVKKWVIEQWQYLWNQHRAKLLSAKKWGFAPLQVVFKMKDNLLCIKGIKDFAPEDCRALEQDSRLCGFRVKGERVFFPQALWLSFAAEHGSAYGYGCLRRMYPAWYEKWMNHGAKRLQQLRMIKDAYIGDIFWYPPNLLVDMPDGTQLSWRDMLREVAEKRLSGGALTLPRLLDGQGKELTGYTPPQGIPGTQIVFDWKEDTDKNILMGADVPMEVVQAGDTGSGYSGRSIPFLVVLSNCTQELIELVAAVKEQVLRPMAWLNWGGDTEFDIEAVSLVESFSRDASGSAMGGSAVGSPQGQSQPVQGPQAQGESVQFGEEAPEPAHLFQHGPVERHEGYHYHATNHENLHSIAQTGKLLTHRPDHGTDQSAWPDGSRKKRAYFHHNPESTKHFAPEHGKPVLIRTKHPVKRESTGDSYVEKPIHVKHLEYLGHNNTWHPVSALSSSQHSEGIEYDDKDKRTLHAPPGGVTIHGVKYKGGEFIPKEVIERLTPEERSKVEAGSVARHIKKKPELSKEGKKRKVKENEDSFYSADWIAGNKAAKQFKELSKRATEEEIDSAIQNAADTSGVNEYSQDEAKTKIYWETALATLEMAVDQREGEELNKRKGSQHSELDDVEQAASETEKPSSEEQSEAGNYKKGKVNLHGLTISIENPKGTRRKPEWPPLSAHYGYINRTEGKDGDHVDVFIGPCPESEVIYVIDQCGKSGEKFDEHKCVLGTYTEEDAKALYLANYTKDWTCGPITAMTVDQFKAWLKDGDTKKPVAGQVSQFSENKESVPSTPFR